MIQKCALGVKVTFLIICLTPNVFAQSLTPQFEEEYNVRPLTEINEVGYGDAYPWISDDGLRLYYTGFDHKNGVDAIHVGKRENTNDAFSNFEILNVNSTQVDNRSAWFNKDETQVAFVRLERQFRLESAIYLATRDHHSDRFKQVQKIDIEGDLRGILLSPSFTPDLKELIAFNEYRNNLFLLSFEKSGVSTYTVKHKLNIPNNYKVKTGKLSHDGLTYYLSLERKGFNPKIYVLTRSSLEEPFSLLHPIHNKSINDTAIRSHQPHFSDDGNFVVFTRSDTDDWKMNDIYIGYKREGNSVLNNEDIVNHNDFLDNLVIYPNPTTEYVTLSEFDNKGYTLNIFDLKGHLLKTIKGNELKYKIDISNLDSGSYIFQFINSSQRKKKSFRIIKVE